METATVDPRAVEAVPLPIDPSPILEVRGAVVRYGRQTVIDHLDLTLEAGEVYALLGRNGSGKSSLVRALLGLQPATAGRVRVLGHDPHRHRAALMREVGYVPEEPQAPPEMTASDLSSFCARVRGTWDAGAVSARLGRLGIPLNRPFRRLSKGQKKQVELALALGHQPRLVVLDDPTLGLDPLARRGFFGELMAELAEGGTSVLLTTHDLDAVEGIANRVGVLAAGRLLVDEPLDRLKGRFRRLLLAPGREDALTALAPVRRQPRPWGVEVVVGGWRDDAEIAAEARPMTLDEIFAALHPLPEERR